MRLSDLSVSLKGRVERALLGLLRTVQPDNRQGAGWAVPSALEMETVLDLVVTRTEGAPGDIHQVRAQIAERIAQAMQVEMCGIWLYRQDEQVLIGQPPFFGVADEIASSFRWPVTNGSKAWKLWHERDFWILNDVAGQRLVEEVGLRHLEQVAVWRDIVFAPLIVGRRRIGAIQVANKIDGTPFDQADARLLCVFAKQAAAVVENARLFETQQKQLREMGILFETSAAISSSLDLKEVLSTVARHMAYALEVSSCSISDWDPIRNVVSTMVAEATSTDVPATLITADIGTLYALAEYPATAKVLHDRKPLVIQVEDPEADPAERALLEAMGQKSALLMPLQTRDRVVGLLELYENRHSRQFSADDIRLCRALASQAAVAIDNARLYEQTDERLRDRVDELTALQRTMQELNATLELDHILHVVLESAVQTSGATHGNVLLMDLESGQFAVRSVRGYSRDEEAAIAAQFRGAGKGSVARQVAESGQSRIVDDMRREPGLARVRDDSLSALVVPIFYQDAVVGLINLRHSEAGSFHKDDLTFVEALAQQAAIAIGNAMRYEEQVRVNNVLRQRTEQLDGLLAVSQKLRTDVALEEVLEEVAYAIQETVGFDIVLISIVEDLQSEVPMLQRVAAAGLPLEVFEEAKRVRQPLERYERILREEYRRGPCYFFPFQKEDEWGTELHTLVPMPKIEEWQEGKWHRRDVLLAPMRGAGGRLLGHVSVDQPRDGLRPSPRTLEVLAVFANQAAIAVENANLYADARRRAEDLALINEVGQKLTHLVEPRQVLDAVVQGIGLLLQCEFGAVFQPDPVDGELRAVASYGADLDSWAELRSAEGEGLVAHVAATGVPLLIPDTEQEPRFVRGRVPLGSAMLVPVVAGRQVVAVLLAGSPRKHALRAADEVLLATLADQAAVALEGTRLFSSTQQAALRLASLNEIGRRVAAQLELQALLETTVHSLHEYLGYYRVGVFLVDEVSLELTLAAADPAFQAVIPPDYRLKVGEGLPGAAAATGRTVLVNDAFADERYLQVGEWGSPASVSVPIRVGGRVNGVLVVEANRRGAFTEEDAAALEIAADQLAVAIENARLFRERQRRIEQLNVLNEMAQAISSTLELDELLEVVYQQVSRLVDTTNFYIALYDEGKGQITFPFVVDPQQREDWRPRARGEGLTGTVIETGAPLLLPTGAAGMYREEGREIQAGLCRCWLGVPMIGEDRVLGVIAVQDYERERVYDQEHVSLLATVAAQTAVAVRNAQLYRQIVGFSSELESMVEARTRDLEQALAELTVERDRVETLYRITRDLSATLDLDRVLQRALQLFADVLGPEHGTILLVDPDTGQLKLRATLEEGRRLPRHGKPTPWSPGEGLAGWVLEHREPALVADITRDERWQQREGKELEIRSVVAAPLALGGGDILGVLVLGHRQAGYFSQEHLQLITAATAQLAVTVNNSDLYTFIIDQAEQLGAALQAQQEEAAKNRAVLESIGDGVLVLDHNGRVLLVNPAAEEQLGFAAMALEGQHFRHMLGLGDSSVHQELAQGLYHELRRRLERAGETAFPPDPTVRLQAGTRALAVHMAPLVVSLGGAPGLVAALRDISREAEVERLKNEFISTVSHELRTPMTSIKGYTDLLFLGMAGGLTDAQRSFLKIIKSNADRLTALVNDILDISRIETGRMRLSIESLDLRQLVNQSVVSFQEQFREKGVTLEWEEPEELPPVRGDAARVTQVLGNLIANAWHYTPRGGRVTISVHPVDGFLQVDVDDTGIGISPDDVGRIFDRFFRADHPVVQEAAGTGLGLSIVKMFVEMLGGRIWVDSELGAGSTFSFTLPLASTDLPEPVPSLLSPELAAGISRRPKILVVEDDRDLALLLRRQLESEGYQVLLAGTGEDALWLAREAQPQLITLDIMLPDLDGFAVLERLKRNPLTGPIPVVVISVLTDTEKGYALGAVDYIVKPFGEETLLEVVRKALHFTTQVKPQKLLVADDDPRVLARVEAALTLHGYQIWTASNGQEALARVGECQPDLILLDVKMPVVDGYEVIRRLRSDEVTRPIPIIVITDSPVDSVQNRVRVVGAEDCQFLTKPLSIETLIRGIKKAMMEKSPA